MLLLQSILVVLCIIPLGSSNQDISLCLYAATPSSYSHSYGGGAVNCKDSKDVVSTITADDINCGDIVSFLVLIEASESCGRGPSTVSFTLSLPAGPSSDSYAGIGFTEIVNVSVNYGLVENGEIDEYGNTQDGGSGCVGYDSGISDNQNSVASIIGKPTLRGTPFTCGSTLTTTIGVTNVEASENVVVRVDARVCCTADADPECSNAELPVIMNSCDTNSDYSCLCNPNTNQVGISVNPQIICCDHNLCTRDVTTYGVNCSCSAVPKNCSDGIACTNDTCNPTTGVCSNTPSCEDNNPCTQNLCNTSGCFFIPINCDDGNVCTVDSCNSTTGCVHKNISCSDNIACTVDSCNPKTGCAHIPNNTLCPQNASNLCLVSFCNLEEGCTTSNLVCADSNLCTLDLCVPSSGCSFPVKNCSDNNLCTTDSCLNGTCSHVNISCNDSNLCTTDSCNPSTGCVHTNISCNDSNACTLDQCFPSTGCTHTNISCDDGNACTLELCIPATGCSYPNISCDDNNSCTLDQCFVETGCSHTNISCDDNNSCTLDQCFVETGCSHTNISCNNSNACTLHLCLPSSGCYYPNITCDDGNACTVDTCNPESGCVHTLINCNDGTLCTSDTCNNTTGCLHTPINCTDSNLCTVDRCLNGTGCDHSQLVVCNHPPVPCANPRGKCFQSLGCVYTADNASCNPPPCFASFCDLTSGCVNTPVDCNNGNPCEIGTCTVQNGAGVCSNSPSNVCDDGILCTLDTCTPVGTNNFTCSHVFEPATLCLASVSDFPQDCGVFFCNQTIDCGVILDPSLCTISKFTCQAYTCTETAGSTLGCGVVSTCDPGCTCESDAPCVCNGGPQKRRRSLLSQITSLWNGAEPRQWSLGLFCVSLSIYLLLLLLL